MAIVDEELELDEEHNNLISSSLHPFIPCLTAHQSCISNDAIIFSRQHVCINIASSWGSPNGRMISITWISGGLISSELRCVYMRLTLRDADTDTTKSPILLLQIIVIVSLCSRWPKFNLARSLLCIEVAVCNLWISLIRELWLCFTRLDYFYLPDSLRMSSRRLLGVNLSQVWDV